MLNTAIERQVMRSVGMGERLRWFQAFPCSCYDPETNRAVEGCTVAGCEGGWLYTEVAIPAGVRVVVVSITKDMFHQDLGFLEMGQLTVRWMPGELALATNDRIVLIGRSQIATERVAKGNDRLDQLYPTELEHVAFEGSEYEVGVDCTLGSTPDADARLAVEWHGGAGPAADAIYGVRYRYNLHYYLIGRGMAVPPQGHGGELPGMAVLTLKRPGAI